MFDCLLKQYEVDVFKTKAESNIGKFLELHKKVLFIVMVSMIVLGMVLSVVCQENKYLSLVAIVLVVGGFVGLLLFQNKSKPIILEVINRPTKKTQMKDMINLLKNFNINVRNERKLNQLIERAERAKKEQDQKKLWSLLKNVIFMVLSAFLTKIFKEADWQTSIDIAIKPILISAMALFFGGFLRDFFFISKKQILDSFISDVEDIKLFPDKVCSLINEMKKKAEEKASRQKIIKALKSKFAGNIASKRRKPDGPCVPEYAIKAEKEGAGTLGDPQAAGHKKPSQSAEQK
ncbi:hypothetical protein [Pseudoramibacter alactolyticus]|uniref:hypothetical protein n=1 Tax=Pseudoramibacter alactolyticus TaxID=113287 RepID=UPI0028E9D14F|nr:hypothetical protein [Pseudoramibacter alactolyticus]